jgi:hypothetical protein
MSTAEEKSAELKQAALEYHEFPTPGKVAVTATKQLLNQRDLALAYSPGVAAACEAIVEDPANAFRYTSRGNLVAVVTNGTAVLGLGDIGPLASKPSSTSSSTRRTSTSWSTSSPRWSPPSVASTSRTSRHRSASRSSDGCASA